jgi:hypothetical protein
MTDKWLTQFTNPPALRHLKRLTTKDGLIQHADHDVPDPSHGYSIDDNARALIACLWYYQAFKDPAVIRLAEIYFHYLVNAKTDSGSFHNFISFRAQFLDEEGSADSYGRVVWALAETTRLHPDEAIREQARTMVSNLDIQQIIAGEHLRSKAYTLLGLVALGDREKSKHIVESITEQFNHHMSDQWQWFEDSLRYANAIIPYALSEYARLTGNENSRMIASKSFLWLDSVSRVNRRPTPIGQNGWYYLGKDRALYDQQPVEAADMILAAFSLFRQTRDDRLFQSIKNWFSWYEGNNLQKTPLINTATGGIFDALTPGGANLNQGAESIVTYLLAYLSLSLHQVQVTNG